MSRKANKLGKLYIVFKSRKAYKLGKLHGVILTDLGTHSRCSLYTRLRTDTQRIREC